jgi:hypothetical protein
MKKTSFLLAALLLFAFISVNATDFSGKWKLSKSKSMLNDQFSLAPNDAVITQKGNDFSIEKHANFQGTDYTISEKYTLDGKECINDGFQGSKKKSTAVWDENKQVLTVKSTLPMQDGTEVSITEVYKMKGSDLEVKSFASSSYGDLDETIVYEKL